MTIDELRKRFETFNNYMTEIYDYVDQFDIESELFVNELWSLRNTDIMRLEEILGEKIVQVDNVSLGNSHEGVIYRIGDDYFKFHGISTSWRIEYEGLKKTEMSTKTVTHWS